MSATLAPRVVVVSRRSELDELLVRHGTRAAAAHFLRERGRDLDETTARHEALQAALTAVDAAIPADWRRGRVDRDDLPRFLFGPEDIAVAVGQDGLVANLAKYLDRQPVIGVDPEPGRNAGILVRFRAAEVGRVLRTVAEESAAVRRLAMVAARLDDGQEINGLNEVYAGHAGHQSARYRLVDAAGRGERQSSSGVLVGTGAGATGWSASIAADRGRREILPAFEASSLSWFVREAWPSPATGTELSSGTLGKGEELRLVCESERLVVFADGVESDHLTVTWGQQVAIGLADRHLHLVVPALQSVRRIRLRPMGSWRYGVPMNRFEGKVAVITGGAKGIGAACTARFASEGAVVYVADVDQEAGERIAAETAGTVHFRRCDASSAADWADLAEDAVEAYGRVDVLVSNAFANLLGAPHELAEADWALTLDVTLKAAYLGVRTLIGPLREARGSVVAVSSVHAHRSHPGYTAYAAAKGGLSALMRQLAVEYAPEVRFNSVAPGPILTTHWADTTDAEIARNGAATLVGRIGRPDEVATAVAYLASEEASYITGAELPVDGGWLAYKTLP
nr:SDR family NAD(P)-dependent oxidoreductase [Glycomyces dulcitolivorans]